MADLETVKIVNPDNADEAIIVNRSDYDVDQGEKGKKEMQLWGGKTVTTEASGSPGPEADAIKDLLEGTVPEVESRLKDVISLEVLTAAKTAEEADGDRKGVKDAIEERIGELES